VCNEFVKVDISELVDLKAQILSCILVLLVSRSDELVVLLESLDAELSHIRSVLLLVEGLGLLGPVVLDF
jgi:hypothetical protein